MCVILASKGKEIPKHYLENSFCNHPHGAGFSYAKDKKIYNEKGFFKFDEFYEAYQKTIGNPIICHFRWATSGLKNKENCHPFVVNENLHFCHNGVISYFTARIKDMSDTYAFNENFLKPIAAESKKKSFFKNEGFKWFVIQDIGKGSKLAFLNNLGHIEIYNEAAGEWADEDKEKNIPGEIWASNASYRVKKDRCVDTCSAIGAYKSGDSEAVTKYKNNSGYGFDYDPDDYAENDRKSLIDPDPADETPDNEINSEPLDITDISSEELAEVDAYLDTLNGASV